MKARVFVALIGALLALAPSTADAGERLDARILVTQSDGTATSIELSYQSDGDDPAKLGALADELRACREEYGDCESASSTEVLRSPELYGTYLGMLAGAFVAGFCAVRPEECAEPLRP